MILLIAGKQGSGKSSVSDEVKKLLVEKKVACWQMSMDMPLYDMHRGVYAMGANYGIPGLPEDRPDKHLLHALRKWGRRGDPDFWLKTTDHKLKQVKESFRNPNLFHVVIIEDIRYLNELEHWPEALSVWLECPKGIRHARVGEFVSDQRQEDLIFRQTPELNKVIETNTVTAEDAAKEIVDFITEKIEGAFA